MRRKKSDMKTENKCKPPVGWDNSFKGPVLWWCLKMTEKIFYGVARSEYLFFLKQLHVETDISKKNALLHTESIVGKGVILNWSKLNYYLVCQHYLWSHFHCWFTELLLPNEAKMYTVPCWHWLLSELQDTNMRLDLKLYCWQELNNINADYQKLAFYYGSRYSVQR